MEKPTLKSDRSLRLSWRLQEFCEQNGGTFKETGTIGPGEGQGSECHFENGFVGVDNKRSGTKLGVRFYGQNQKKERDADRFVDVDFDRDTVSIDGNSFVRVSGDKIEMR